MKIRAADKPHVGVSYQELERQAPKHKKLVYLLSNIKSIDPEVKILVGGGKILLWGLVTNERGAEYRLGQIFDFHELTGVGESLDALSDDATNNPLDVLHGLFIRTLRWMDAAFLSGGTEVGHKIARLIKAYSLLFPEKQEQIMIYSSVLPISPPLSETDIKKMYPDHEAFFKSIMKLSITDYLRMVVLKGEPEDEEDMCFYGVFPDEKGNYGVNEFLRLSRLGIKFSSLKGEGGFNIFRGNIMRDQYMPTLSSHEEKGLAELQRILGPAFNKLC